MGIKLTKLAEECKVIFFVKGTKGKEAKEVPFKEMTESQLRDYVKLQFSNFKKNRANLARYFENTIEELKAFAEGEETGARVAKPKKTKAKEENSDDK